MDTVVRKLMRKAWILGTICVALPTWADTVMLAPTSSKPSNIREDLYPESRFGQPPARVETGFERGFAAREAVDQDADGETVTVTRSPAGLVVGQQGTGAGALSGVEPPVGRAAEANFTRGSDTNALVTSRKGIQEVAVIANDLGFFPKTVFVTRDIPVRMFVTGASKNTLCIMMDSFQVRKQVRTQKIEEITFTPNEPGKYRFYCPVNGMEGTMIVKELVSNVQQ